MKKLNPIICALIVCCASTTGIAHDEGWNLGTGTTVGAVLGGVIGYQVDRHDGAVVGSILGAIAGSRHYHSSHHKHTSRYFNHAEEQRIRDRIKQRIEAETQRFTFSGDSLFEPGTSKLNSTAAAELSTVANALQRYDRTLVHISGFTDSEDQPYKNKVLSLGWAESVAQYLVVQGIPRSRIQTVGTGHADSDRRVEVLVEPIFNAADR